MNTSIFDLDNAVFIQNQQVKTDSLKVAEIFGKRHDNVVRKIESFFEVQSRDLKIEGTDISLYNFASATFSAHVQTIQAGAVKRESKYYEMTKDGFIFLVMGFTGEEATRTKIAYINTFNKMAAMLHNQQYVSQGLQYGAKVQLISGSPEFTVNQMIYDEEGYLHSVEVVCWNKNRLHKEVLSVTSVIPVKGFQNDVLDNFWKAVFAYGLDKLNHSKNPNLIALNLKQVSQSIQGIPSRMELAALLMHSRDPYPKYMQHNYAVQSAVTDKTVKCWVFDTTKPQQAIEYNA